MSNIPLPPLDTPPQQQIGQPPAVSDLSPSPSLQAPPTGMEDLKATLSEDRQKEISRLVVEGYMYDLSTRSEWETRHANWLKLYAVIRDPKTLPWPGCANVGLPMLSMAVLQCQARLYPEVMPSKDLVRTIPIRRVPSEVDLARAERTETYANYYLNFKMPEYRQSHDVTTLKLAIEGCVIRKTYFDPVEKVICSDYLSPTDFVISNSARSIASSRRYTHKQYWTQDDINERVTSLSPEDREKLKSSPVVVVDKVKEQGSKNTGHTSGSVPQDPLNPRLILEQHVVLSLDGVSPAQPYIIRVDKESQVLIDIYSRKNPKTGKKMTYFTKFTFIPNPEGFYDYGFGLFLEGANEALNSGLNALLDAATQSNIKMGFIAKGSGLKKGDIEVSQGMFKNIEMRNDDIRKAIMPFEFGEPSQTLYSLLGFLQGYADRLTTVTETQTGKLPSSDTSATAVAAAIDQGMKVFSAIIKRYYESEKWEINLIYELIGIHLDIEEYAKMVTDERKLFTPVQNPDGTVGQKPVPIQDLYDVYAGDFDHPQDIRPVSDPNMQNIQEKAAQAQMAYNTVLTNPLSAQDPQAIYQATVNLYKSVDIDEATIDILVKMPPPPQPPPDLPQEEENKIFINDGMVDAQPQQNHEQHLAIIDEFENSPFAQSLTPKGRAALETHRRQHVAFLYGQSVQHTRQKEADMIREHEAGGGVPVE